mgnify:CR=1 FL=1
MIRLNREGGNRRMNQLVIRTLEDYPTLHISWNISSWKQTYIETFFHRSIDSLSSIVRVYKVDNKPPYRYGPYIQNKTAVITEKEIQVEVDNNKQYIVELLVTDNKYSLAVEKSTVIKVNKKDSHSTTVDWINDERNNNWKEHFSTYTYYNISNEDD